MTCPGSGRFAAGGSEEAATGTARDRSVVAGGDGPDAVNLDPPAVAAEPVRGLGAEPAFPQRGDPAHPRHGACAADRAVGAGARVIRKVIRVFEGNRAARSRQAGNGCEQLASFLGGEVDEQTLGQPRGAFTRPQSAVEEYAGPVLPQVGCPGHAMASRDGVAAGQDGVLEGQHIGLVDLEQPGAGGPVEPVSAGIHAGGEEHDLAASGRAGSEQVVVEEPGADGDPRLEDSAKRGGLAWRGTVDPGAASTNAPGAASTNAPVYGSWKSRSARSLSRARIFATPIAVWPTP